MTLFPKKQGIVDAKGNITFESSEKGGIFHIFKNRFILYSEEGGRRKSAIIDEKGNELVPFEYQDFNTPWWSKERIIASRQRKEAVYDYNGKLIIPDSDKIRFAGKEAFFVLKDKNGSCTILTESSLAKGNLKTITALKMEKLSSVMKKIKVRS